MRTRQLRIQTPEGVVFALVIAGPFARFLAWLIDLLCVVAGGSLVRTALGIFGVFSADVGQAFALVAFFVVQIGYGIGAEWFWRGQTVGKRLLRLRVVDAEGLRLQFPQVVMRNLLRFVDMLPACYLVGGLAAWLSPRGQRLGDLAAGTMVIWQPPLAPPDLDALAAGKWNSLGAFPHLVARLRQRTSAEEGALALQALRRREEFEPAARVALFHELAEHFSKKETGFPPEAVEMLTDEQYLRNVADLLFRRSVREDKGGR